MIGEAMKVRLTSRWGARLPGQIVSVSKDRAEYLQNELKIGKIMDPLPKRPSVKEVQETESNEVAAKPAAKRGRPAKKED